MARGRKNERNIRKSKYKNRRREEGWRGKKERGKKYQEK